MDTCLFTGEPLTATTREEHTIPECVGGRIKSRIVTSDRFNNLCGSCADHIFKLPYEPLLNHLSPLLPRTCQSGQMSIDVPGEQQGLVLEAGRIGRAGVVIVERDDRGRPKAAVGEDLNALRQLARSMKKNPDEMRLSEVKATEAVTYHKKVPVITWELEFVALKSILLTFDHLLRGSPDRFTRHVDLGPIREFIRATVEERRPPSRALAECSFGLQYGKRELYARLREQIDLPKSEFEHVLFVSTEARTRTLELVWLVFGFDPFGFQICPWTHGSFTYGIVNPILRDLGPSGLHRIVNPGEPLCEPSNFCAMPWDKPQPVDHCLVLEQISQERHDSFGRAVKLVEMTADDNLIECFSEASALSVASERSVQNQIRFRLIRMYGRRNDDVEFLNDVDSILADMSEGTDEELLSRSINGLGNETLDWTSIIGLYRRCLVDLEHRYGLPGDNFTNSCGIILDPSDQRDIGKLPPM